MPKKIPLVTVREWLTQYEQGKSEAQIAKDAQKDVQTVKRGLERARLERISLTAQAEMLSRALQGHQDKLISVIKETLSSITMPSPHLNLELPVQLDGATVAYDKLKGLFATLNVELSLEWELLREHLTRDRLWKQLNIWRQAMVDYIMARRDLHRHIESLLLKKTGLPLEEKSITPPFLYAIAVDRLCTTLLQHQLDTDGKFDISVKIMANTDNGMVSLGIGQLLAEAPGIEEKSRLGIIKAYKTAAKSKQVASVTETRLKLEGVVQKTRRILEEILLLGLIPGRCRVCRRLGSQ